MSVNTFPIILEEAFMLSPKVKHFIFRRIEEPAFHYLPGQFITIHFERDGTLLRRSYSIANVPTQDNRIEFAAGYVEGGPGTELLFNLQPGDTIHINGPFGRLILKDDMPKRYIFVATSTGITPYRAMIPELKRRLQINPELNIVILQGVQKREDILYGNEFLALAATSPRINFRAHLSRETQDNRQSHEYIGYVQHSFDELALNPAEDVVYLCGNPGMIDESFAYLKEKGFAMQSIIREKYISGK
ncbi:ferredoxin--NADP reductase [Legionella oakridgensis]|uniref:ferredoxin--NADP(+) reductase n=2 Tax=Legionella oakridgensis TaxID=29423 RepID=W0BCE0_9GAMM|nr:ferredoxin--NADP reductase [Legionella oakridgensis]AHE66351.1 flavodoxin reductases ferredoxin-NADPH reductases family 1 [Legionella oakridgensis ATCC 33761 = DSM 21215]ETO93857.1 flavodoxin reductase (ferredoxin-NADPH reductase) family 1 [Legionella oakridgensis RV-2-2007]KTD43994.1 phenol hydroxylase [Legionella oakridgensis]STY19535.1 phenol hydroxylase [Legionella longbeachae]